jgi:molybdopterin molybdotransferase
MAFLSVQECIKKLLDSNAITAEIQTNALLDSLDLVLAEDVISDVDVPPADNSAMDGYAFRYADAQNSTTLSISQRIQAGDTGTPLQNNTVARIFTGAEIPEKADTVEMQENCHVNDDDSITFTQEVKPENNIRRQGQDIQKGTIIVKKGQRLRAQELGLLASIGMSSVKTYKPLNIAIINTGNELVEPGKTLEKGQIYNSNRFLLDGLLRKWGFVTHHHNIVEDTLKQTKEALLTVSQNNDIVITTGGVSVGEEDHIKPAVESLGSIDLWKVAVKPGKPFAFGNIKSNSDSKANTPFIGRPGNPSSVFATLLILARQFLLQQQGLQGNLEPIINSATATFSRKSVGREEYLRANYNNGSVDIFMNQSSGVLTSASWGNCFVKQEIGTAIEKGDTVQIIFYSNL